MFGNYFKTAWRNLIKHKGDTTINLVGLCVAFTSALLLLLSVYYEFSFDRFHKNAANTYELYFETHRPETTELSRSMPVPLLPSLKEMYPEVKAGTRFMTDGTAIRYGDKQLQEQLLFADPDFLTMFSFPLLSGTKETALDDMDKIVLRKATATAIFGDEDPMHKVIQVKVNGEWRNFTVNGILDNFPDNSSIRYDMLVRFELSEDYKESMDQWDNRNHDVFIALDSHTDMASFEKKLPAFVKQYFAENIQRLKRDGAAPAPDGDFIKLRLLPLTAIHTDTKVGGMGPSINRGYLYLLLVIAGLIIAIACINFVNLSLGRSFTRSREIGLRKTLGARRGQLAFQFWSEALILCFAAFVISCAATYLLLPYYKQLFAMNVQREVLSSPVVWAGILPAFLLITLLAGGYPAWIMARFNIVNILKGKLSVRHSQKLRHSLIVVQFAIAILLMVCTLVAWQQINYLRSRPLGYNRNQVVSIPVTGAMDPTMALQRMRNELASYPAVESITGIYDNLGRGTDGSSRTSIVGFEYKNRGMKSNWMGISYDFVKTLDLKLVDGRDFSRNMPTDSNAVLINEAMARQLNEPNVVGTQLPIDSARPSTVIGVVKDFNFKSLHKKIEPLTLVLDKEFAINYILVKVKPTDLPGSMALLKKTWLKIAPGTDFLGSFLDENIDRQYRRETKMGQIFIAGAVIAIVLSCMGLLAMVILVVTQRIKEIGVRKVLGASVTNIVLLLSKDFLKLVVIAAIIAFPLGWWAMHSWLAKYAYHISVPLWVFAAAGLLAALIALLTISIQAIRAAVTNPVKSLRSE